MNAYIHLQVIDGPAFAAFIRHVLVPELEPGTAVVLDNLATHRTVVNLGRIGARSFTQLFNAIGEVCGMFSPQECWNYFKAAGYVST